MYYNYTDSDKKKDMGSSSYSFSHSYVTTQLTIISAESLLTTSKRPIKHKTFVAISVEDGHQIFAKQQQQEQLPQCTQLSEEGGSNPSWNEKLEISIPVHTHYITLEVRYAASTTSIEKSHNIGFARVPTSDFVGHNFNNSNDYLHFLSYRLRDQYGNPNGIINISVKVLKGSNSTQQPPIGAAYRMYKGSMGKIGGQSGYKRSEHYEHGTNLAWIGVHGWRNPNAVVVGVPAPMAWQS